MRFLPIIIVLLIASGIVYISQSNHRNIPQIANLPQQNQNKLDYTAENPQSREFKSKLLGFTIKIPSGYTSSIKNEANYEYLMIDKAGDNVTLEVFPVTAACGSNQENNTFGSGGAQNLNIGGKYPITLYSAGSISHGEANHFFNGQAKTDNSYCLKVSERINVNSLQTIANILEGK